MSAVPIRKVGDVSMLGTELAFNEVERCIEADFCSARFESAEVDKREPVL
jgi:hypothetical protein